MATESPTRADDGASSNGRPTKRRRIAVACEACRTRKSRCDGSNPKCSTCQQMCTECSYPPQLSKSDQLREEFTSTVGSLEERIGGIERLLTRLTSIIPSNQDTEAPPRSRGTASAGPSAEPDEIVLSDNALQDASLNDSPADAIGIVPLTSREVQFFGPSSNIAFLRLVYRALAKATGRAADSIGPTIRNANNGRTTLQEQEAPQPLTPGYTTGSPWAQGQPKLKLPNERRARELLINYFDDCGVIHPIIHEGRFMDTFGEVCRSNWTKIRPSWLAMLYIMFSLSALSGPPRRVSTARVSPEAEAWFELAYSICVKQVFYENVANLDLVQCLTLLALYLQGTHNSYRIWMVYGLALRVAQQLGLHSKEASKVSTDPVESEIRTRTWWTIFMLDTTLGMSFGRPVSADTSTSNQADPQVFEDSARRNIIGQDQACVSFMRANLNLWKVYSRTISILYSNNSGSRLDLSLTSVAHIFNLEDDLLRWRDNLDPQVKALSRSDMMSLTTIPTENMALKLRRYRVILTLRYLNARILIHRSVLESLLDAYISSHPNLEHLNLMQQASAHSLKIMIDSTTGVISLIHVLVTSVSRGSQILGAWWFSLYYTFNAALAILATLLISRPSWAEANMLTKDDREAALRALNQSLEILDGLDEGHSTVSRCRDYLQELVSIARPLHSDSGVPGDALAGTNMSGIYGVPEGIRPVSAQQQALTSDFDFESFLFPADMQAFGDTFAAFNQSLV